MGRFVNKIKGSTLVAVGTLRRNRRMQAEGRLLQLQGRVQGFTKKLQRNFS